MALDDAIILMVVAVGCGKVRKNVVGSTGRWGLSGPLVRRAEAPTVGLRWQRWQLGVMCETSRAALTSGDVLPEA